MPNQNVSPSKAVKVVIQGGLVPKETVQQLIRWGLLPDNSRELIGSLPGNDFETQWGTVEEFVKTLGAALAKEAAVIRETELDPAGGFQDVLVEFATRLKQFLNDWKPYRVIAGI